MRIQVIPAIDLIDGQCVRLSQGDYQQKKVYHADPVEVAKQFEGVGCKRLHLVDLDGAKAGHVVNLQVLERIAANTTLEIDFGGGVKNESDLHSVFSAGASMVTCGSIAQREPEMFSSWIQSFGAEKMILAADTRHGMIAIAGWLETTQEPVTSFVRHYVSQGLNQVLCTDISKDGMLQGPSVDLYQQLLDEMPGISLIASGGVSGVGDIHTLDAMGVPFVVVGKAIYDGLITMEQLKELHV